MRILLSNDDGCNAPGLRCLHEALRSVHEVAVVAPDRNRSAASNSLTLLHPLRTHRHADGVICVDGTPTDCVHLALNGLIDPPPDIVVSGINAGANLGDDTLYSGTVAAAMEGRWLGFPAIAVSTVTADPQHYATAAGIVLRLLEQIERAPLPASSILNVNVPDVPASEIEGIEITRLGYRHRSEAVVQTCDPRGRPIYWINTAGEEQDGGPGTDFHAVAQRRVSITPLHIDLTRHASIEPLRAWVQHL